MVIPCLNCYLLTGTEECDIAQSYGPYAFGCADPSEVNELKQSTSEVASPLSSPRTLDDADTTDPLRINLPYLVIAPLVPREPYLDILEAAVVLRLAPCQVRWLAETGLIPAHALKHDRQTCWKFRLTEFLIWAAGIDAEISPQSLCSLLSSGDRTQ